MYMKAQAGLPLQRGRKEPKTDKTRQDSGVLSERIPRLECRTSHVASPLPQKKEKSNN